jgi:hypothetical protein
MGGGLQFFADPLPDFFSMRSFLRSSFVVAVAAAFLSGCDSGSPSPTPVSVVISAGDNQSAAVGSVLSNLQIEVRDAEGVAIGGLSFAVAVQSGGGTYSGTVTKTVKGAPTALGTWTLGTTAGPQSLRITAGSLAGTVTANSVAGAPSAIVVGGAPGAPTQTTGGVGGVASITPSVRLMDSFGNAVSGRAVSVVVTGGGSVANPNPVTDASGLATTGVWTLGTVAGTQSVTINGTGGAPAVFTAEVAPGPASQLVAVSPPSGTRVVGVGISNLEFSVQDAFGNGIAGVPVTFAVTSGGGQATILASATNVQGRVSPGTWTMGTLVGTNTLRASALTFERSISVTTVPDAVSQIAVVAGAGQSATQSTALPVNPVFSARDQYGNAIVGQTMNFAVQFGGGTLGVASAPTAAVTGEATPGTWTLGALVGTQTISATVGNAATTLSATALAPGAPPPVPGAAYRVEVRFVGTPPSLAVQNAFNAAAQRIESMITGDLPNIPFAGFDYAAQCGVAGAPVINETIDDLVIFASVAPIDGPNGILGSASPCMIRSTGKLPILGDMVFDSADLDVMVSQGIIGSVVLHEMLHVVGIGTIWDPSLLNLLSGGGGPNPFFTGAQARAQYLAIGGNAALSGVPVENTGVVGDGTRDGHWRESIFGRELMTGFVGPGAVMPLSLMSIGALGDLGYTVNLGAADAYTVSAALRSNQLSEPSAAHSDVIPPRFTVDASGRVTAIPGRGALRREGSSRK